MSIFKIVASAFLPIYRKRSIRPIEDPVVVCMNLVKVYFGPFIAPTGLSEASVRVKVPSIQLVCDRFVGPRAHCYKCLVVKRKDCAQIRRGNRYNLGIIEYKNEF